MLVHALRKRVSTVRPLALCVVCPNRRVRSASQVSTCINKGPKKMDYPLTTNSIGNTVHFFATNAHGSGLEIMSAAVSLVSHITHDLVRCVLFSRTTTGILGLEPDPKQKMRCTIQRNRTLKGIDARTRSNALTRSVVISS